MVRVYIEGAPGCGKELVIDELKKDGTNKYFTTSRLSELMKVHYYDWPTNRDKLSNYFKTGMYPELDDQIVIILDSDINTCLARMNGLEKAPNYELTYNNIMTTCQYMYNYGMSFIYPSNIDEKEIVDRKNKYLKIASFYKFPVIETTNLSSEDIVKLIHEIVDQN